MGGEWREWEGLRDLEWEPVGCLSYVLRYGTTRSCKMFDTIWDDKTSQDVGGCNSQRIYGLKILRPHGVTIDGVTIFKEARFYGVNDLRH